MATEPHQYVLRDYRTGELVREATDDEVHESNTTKTWRFGPHNGSNGGVVEVDGRLCYVEG